MKTKHDRRAKRVLGRVLGCALSVVALASCLFLVACGGGAATSATSAASSSQQTDYKHVDVEEAMQLMDDPGSILVDVRGEVSYDMGHIPGAVCIGYDKIESGEALSLLPDKNQLIIVYCDYGGVSKKAAAKLASEGYANVVEFDGLAVWEGDLEVNE